MIVTSAPGKLFIAGEYAVTQPGYPAILVAVDQFITVSLEKASDEGSISSYDDISILWTREKDKIVLKRPNNCFSHILAAINIVEAYAKEQGKKLDFYNIKVSSQLESKKGKKYGLGSSGAVTVATIEALCRYYEIHISDEKLFKLAALAQLSINNNGSCGDIAASIYSGWIAFRTFDRNWVLKERKNNSIKELLNRQWPSLSIEPLIPPKELELVIGWTGSPASTASLVNHVNDKRIENNILYEEFLYNSRICVTKMISAFKEKNIKEIQKQIQINRQLLLKMSNDLSLIIETPLLTKLCDIALQFNGYAKSSGAGGGDCGIAIFQDNRNLTLLIEEWEKVGITYLPLKIFNKILT